VDRARRRARHCPRMSKFAAYDPTRTGAPRLTAADGLVVRPTTAADLADVARIVAEREEEDEALVRGRLAREFAAPADPPTRALWVATVADRVVAHARAFRFEPSVNAPADVAPAGWYLAGVIVDPSWRRRGIGDALTSARLEWIARRADRALYFANARNRVTIELHAKLGFVELTRSFSYPGVTFDGGVGVLFERRWT